METRRRASLALVAAIVLGALMLDPANQGYADGLPAPTGEVILTIDGAIDRTNSGHAAAFDLAMLKTMPVTQFVTETPWTKGPHSFSGVALSDLLAWIGAHGTQLRAVALNDYSAEIPVSDAKRFGMLVAYLFDGKPMLASDRGPLWVVYPFSDRPETDTETYQIRSVWTLVTLTVH